MIPAVFVSSTIRDLRYLRDALRDAILELSYQPVMSDYGEVTYIHSGSAADACFKSVERCHLVVLIVGRRYGDLVDGVCGVTHKEFLTAKDANIPMFAFVEAQVLNYKEVFDTDPKAELWNAFPGMDNARMTFRLIDEIKTASASNGLIPFTTAGEAKQVLKAQIADFVGQRLGSLIQPIRNELQELSAEVRTLRKQLTATKPTSRKIALASERYLEPVMHFGGR